MTYYPDNKVSEHTVKHAGKSVSNLSEDLNNVKKVIDSNSNDAGIEEAPAHNSGRNLNGEHVQDFLIIIHIHKFCNESTREFLLNSFLSFLASL